MNNLNYSAFQLTKFCKKTPKCQNIAGVDRSILVDDTKPKEPVTLTVTGSFVIKHVVIHDKVKITNKLIDHLTQR